jgi:hypothetical protein
METPSVLDLILKAQQTKDFTKLGQHMSEQLMFDSKLKPMLLNWILTPMLEKVQVQECVKHYEPWYYQESPPGV